MVFVDLHATEETLESISFSLLHWRGASLQQISGHNIQRRDLLLRNKKSPMVSNKQ